MSIVNRSIEILTFKWMSIMVVLAVHNLVIVLVATFDILLEVFDLTMWAYRCSLLPEILILSIKLIPLTRAITWCPILICKPICILMISTPFIKELSELSVITGIVFAFSYVWLWIPRWQHQLWRLSPIWIFFCSGWEWTHISRIVMWIILAIQLHIILFLNRRSIFKVLMRIIIWLFRNRLIFRPIILLNLWIKHTFMVLFCLWHFIILIFKLN